LAEGQGGEEGGVGFVGPCSAMEDEGEVTGDGDAHARAVLEFVLPDAFETGGEQVADGGEHVEIEEREAIGCGGGQFAGESAFAGDLGAEGGGSELVTESGEGAVVFGVEASAGGGLQEPGATVVVSCVAGETGEAGRGEPFEVVSEPLLNDGEVGVREGF
jgi:hypothetical protein